MTRVQRAAVGLFFTAGASWAAPVYTFNIVAKTGDVIGGKTLAAFYPPSINNSGKVAFVASNQGGTKGVFTQTGALAFTGDTIGGQTLTDLNLYSSLNDAGAVAFLAPYSGGTGIFSQSAVLVKTGDSIGGKTITFPYLTPRALNENGAVAFYVEYAGGKGVFTQTNLLAKTGDTIGGQTLTDIDTFVALNNAGAAAFEGTYGGGSGIFTQTNVLAKTGDIIGGQALSAFGINALGPALNDNGTAAFYAAFGSNTGILTQDGVIVKVGDVVGGKTLTGVFGQTINSSGTVAYIGFYSSGHGIFTQNGGVVQTGDVIGGKTIASLSFAFGPALNDKNDVAFLANFTDSTSGIVVATLTNPDVPCATLAVGSVQIPAAGASGNFSVSGGFGCSWTPFTHVDWITVSSPGPVSGSGVPNFTVAANNSALPRSGTISLSFVGQPFRPNQVFTINQAGTACSFTLSPPPGPIPSAGGPRSTTVTAGSGSCPWNAVSNTVWITVTSGNSGFGSGSASYSIAPNPGPSRTGTLTVAGQTVTITQQAQPTPVSVTPASGTGPASFSFTFTDPDGWQDLGILNVLINNALDGRHACYIAFLPSGATGGSVLLVNDIGDASGPFATLALGTADTIGNSQCTIKGTGSSVSGSGNTRVLTLAMVFGAGFAGNKVVYTAARDVSFNNSGWQALGVWNVPGPEPIGPAVSGVTPQRSSAASQDYTFTFTDTNGYQDVAILNVLINRALDGRNACYIAYVRSLNTVLLVNDAGDASGPFQSLVIGSTDVVQNSQCAISGTGSMAAGSGNTFTLTLPITFTSGFTGNQVIYAAARSNTQTSNWQAVGSVTAP